MAVVQKAVETSYKRDRTLGTGQSKQGLSRRCGGLMIHPPSELASIRANGALE